jgi:hypothetical protein
MAKLLLLGIVLFTAILPVLFVSSRSPKRALRTIQILCFLGVVFWSYLARVWYPIYAPLWEQIPK